MLIKPCMSIVYRAYKGKNDDSGAVQYVSVCMEGVSVDAIYAEVALRSCVVR